MAIDFTTDVGQVRLLINDVNESAEVFSNSEIGAFLELEAGNVKLAAAQALDTIADDEALTSKAIRSQDLATDGAKVAGVLRARAKSLREEARGSSVSLAPRGCFPAAPDDSPWR